MKARIFRRPERLCRKIGNSVVIFLKKYDNKSSLMGTQSGLTPKKAEPSPCFEPLVFTGKVAKISSKWLACTDVSSYLSRHLGSVFMTPKLRLHVFAAKFGCVISFFLSIFHHVPACAGWYFFRVRLPTPQNNLGHAGATIFFGRQPSFSHRHWRFRPILLCFSHINQPFISVPV